MSQEQTGQQPGQQPQPGQPQNAPQQQQSVHESHASMGESAAAATSPNQPQNPQQQQPNQPQSSPSASSGSQKSSADLEAENRALRAILSGHVSGINIDEELEFVGPTGKYRPSAPAGQQEQVPDQRTSRRQGLQSARAEGGQSVDVAAIDKEFDNFLKINYGFDIDEGKQNDY